MRYFPSVKHVFKNFVVWLSLDVWHETCFVVFGCSGPRARVKEQADVERIRTSALL